MVAELEKEYFQIERFGYAHSSVQTKIRILKVLCEKQFDFNPKFKEHVIVYYFCHATLLLLYGS